MIKFRIKFMYAIILALCIYSTVSANVNINITPKPKELTYKGYEIKLDSDWNIVIDKTKQDNIIIAEYFNNFLEEKGVNLTVKDSDDLEAKKIIMLINVEIQEDLNNLSYYEDINLPEKFESEGYLLEMFSDRIIILSKDSAGLFYGMQTLIQLSNKGNGLKFSAVRIYDYPRIKARGVHLLYHDLDTIKPKLDYLAKLRINRVILANKHYFDLDNLVYREKLKEIFDYAKKLHIEPIPELQSFGAAGDILRKNPHAAEGIYLQDEPFKFKNNVAYPVISSKINIQNPDFEKEKDGWQLGEDWKIDDDSYRGNFSAKISVDGPYPRRSSILKSKEYYAIPNAIYSCSFFAKTEGIGGKYPPALRVVELSSEGNWIRQHNLHVKNNSWDRLELNFKTSPECSKVYVYANIWDGYGQAWFDDIGLRRVDNALVNVIRTGSSDLIIKSEKGNIIYKENKDYEIINGEMKYPYFCDNKPLVIKRMSSGRIKKDEKILVTYDYVVGMVPFAEWSIPYCPFEPETYKVMGKALENVINLLHPEFISIGHDEIRGLNRDSRCRKQNLTNAEILGYDINNLYKIIRRLDKEVRILIWDDMLNPWHNGGDENYQVQFGGISGKTAGALALIPKDIILMVWWDYPKGWLEKMKNSPDYFKANKFGYVVVDYKNKKNIQEWVTVIKNRPECLGIIVTTWDGFENNLEEIKFMAESSWSG